MWTHYLNPRLANHCEVPGTLFNCKEPREISSTRVSHRGLTLHDITHVLNQRNNPNRRLNKVSRILIHSSFQSWPSGNLTWQWNIMGSSYRYQFLYHLQGVCPWFSQPSVLKTAVGFTVAPWSWRSVAPASSMATRCAPNERPSRPCGPSPTRKPWWNGWVV